MLKKLIIGSILLLFLTIPAQATAPPANGGYSAGWGMNPTNWNNHSGSWSSGFALYEPTGGGGFGGAGWLVGWNPYVYVNYAPITIELWIEMYMIQTYHYTSYQFHRLGNAAEHLCFTIQGTVQSNEGVWVLCTQGTLDPDFLHFQHNIGVGDDNNARDIPISWEGRYGSSFTYGSNIIMGWTPLTWSGGELILDEFDACDHWFEFRGCMDLLYHEADGYYFLDLAGCPAPQL
jgi:hypothetical protein